MIKLKKVASYFRNVERLIVKKDGQDNYWVTDTYLLLVLNEEEFKQLKEKYNSYKNNINIPNNKDNFTIVDKQKLENKSFVLNFRPNRRKEKVAVATNLIFKSKDKKIRLISYEDEVIAVNNKYYKFIEDIEGLSFYSESKFNGLNCYNDKEQLKAIIMPIRLNNLNNDKERLINDLKKFERLI